METPAATANETDVVVEMAGQGLERLDFSAFDSTNAVTVNLGSDAALATHTNRTVKTDVAGQATNFENVTGGAGHDRLTGNVANNRLEGGGGNDMMTGGTGDDVYVFAAATASEIDVVVEMAGQGLDRLDFSTLASTNSVTVNLASDTALATHTNRTVKTNVAGQAAHFENVTGGAGHDRLTGNAANNRLDGGDGNDVYVFAAATKSETDVVVELANKGLDRLDFGALAFTNPVTVNLASDTALATHTNRTVKTDVAGQAANFENVTGGAGHDRLTGNAANNRLDGGDGNDHLFGN